MFLMNGVQRMRFIHVVYKVVSLLLVVWLVGLTTAHAKFYRYTNKDGQSVFVDDEAKIPPEYRKDQKIYLEKYDHLSEEERTLRKALDFQTEKTRRDLEQQREEERARKEYLQRLRTQVIINNNQVLVPVTLGYEGAENTALLVLDTGATITTLHRPVISKLYITEIQKGKMRVAGGSIIGVDVVKLDYIRVGPITRTGIRAGVIEHQGTPVKHNGMLGMNFLRGLKYSIDFENKFIEWAPE